MINGAINAIADSVWENAIIFVADVIRLSFTCLFPF